MASKGRPVSTEDVEEPCLALFKKLLFDLGYEPTCFAFDDNEMSEEQQSGAPEQQETPTTESEPTGTKTEKTFGEIVDDVLNSVIVPNEVSQADRKGGAISLPEWLGQLSLDERDQYAGQLHRLVNGLTDYMQLVTKMINQLSQQKEPTEEERLQGLWICLNVLLRKRRTSLQNISRRTSWTRTLKLTMMNRFCLSQSP